MLTNINTQSQSPIIASGIPRTLVGYGWPWTVRPGESVDFMVSTFADGPYQADLVRIICGDNLSDPAMFKEELLKAEFSGAYPGRHQAVHTGSYVEISPSNALDNVESFTVQALVFPTALPSSPVKKIGGLPDSALAKPLPNQHVVSRWDDQHKQGWALQIEPKGRISFLLGDGQSIHETLLDKPLIENQWFFVVASYDSQTNRVCIRVSPQPRSPCEMSVWEEGHVEAIHPDTMSPIHHGPLRFAACTKGPGNGEHLKPGCCFNGKLDRVRLTAGVLSKQQALDLSKAKIPETLKDRVIGCWDFGQGIDSINVHDISGNELNGVTVNIPTRAVTGIDWDGTSNDWRERSDHYSAIHFHDDDLYDAEWEKDFSYCVPEDLQSGIYAARLRHGDSEDYIPFFVAPPKGKANAAVALLVPTMSYTAYTNVRWDSTRKKSVTDESGERSVIEEPLSRSVVRYAEDVDFLAKQLSCRGTGKGVYHHHTDGRYCNTASQKYPNMTIKAKTASYTLVADTYITDWLEKLGIAYDIITDDLLQAEGVELLKNYPVVMTGNHPEYCSAQILDAIAEYQASGGRWMYMGGNGYFWVTSVHPQLKGAIEVRKDMMYSGIHALNERRHAFDGHSAGLWSNNERPPQLLMGVGMDVPFPFSVDCVPYDRLEGSYSKRVSFVFDGVDNETFGDYGAIGGGAAGQETDSISRTLGSPLHTVHLARSHDFSWPLSGPGGMTAEEYRSNVQMPRADVVFFEGPNGGATFSVGSMAWVGALNHENYDNDVARITENVLRRFMDETPFNFPPISEVERYAGDEGE